MLYFLDYLRYDITNSIKLFGRRWGSSLGDLWSTLCQAASTCSSSFALLIHYCCCSLPRWLMSRWVRHGRQSTGACCYWGSPTGLARSCSYGAPFDHAYVTFRCCFAMLPRCLCRRFACPWTSLPSSIFRWAAIRGPRRAYVVSAICLYRCPGCSSGTVSICLELIALPWWPMRILGQGRQVWWI